MSAGRKSPRGQANARAAAAERRAALAGIEKRARAKGKDPSASSVLATYRRYHPKNAAGKPGRPVEGNVRNMGGGERIVPKPASNPSGNPVGVRGPSPYGPGGVVKRPSSGVTSPAGNAVAAARGIVGDRAGAATPSVKPLPMRIARLPNPPSVQPKKRKG